MLSSSPVRQDAPHDLVCLSHLRWNFVFQRPQHLMSRFARERRVVFFEEPVWTPGPTELKVVHSPEGVWVATPHIHAEGIDRVLPDRPDGASVTEAECLAIQRHMLNQVVPVGGAYDCWFYTPMALRYARHLEPSVTVYDCMDELSQFKGASPELLQLENELFRRADVVFTGGVSLYEAKQARHPNVHACPSSVDVAHFSQARRTLSEPEDQRELARPRIGFFGVIDERLDLELLAALASRRPEWQWVMVGPVVKIASDQLPRLPNLHFMGPKTYQALPSYLSGWDIALMPFALNEATRFISPTKTPEYLAAGKPVVSSAIRDVVRPYGEQGLVRIASGVDGFLRAIEEALEEAKDTDRHTRWLDRVDRFLAHTSWDATWAQMRTELNQPKERKASGT